MKKAEEQAQIIEEHQVAAPVPIIALAKALGFKVYASKELPDRMAGAIKLEEDKSYSIYVNLNFGRNRRRFTVARQIAHFILHKKYVCKGLADNERCSSAVGPVMDDKASTFAAELLMPTALLSRESSPNESLKDMAEKFKVSEALLAARLGENPYAVAVSLCDQL